MRKSFGILLVIAVLAIAGCDRDRSEEARLAAENTRLKSMLAARTKELDELRNGPARLLAQTAAALEKKDYVAAIAAADELTKRHPGSAEATLTITLKQEAAAAVAARDRKAEIERYRKLQDAEDTLNRATAALRTSKDEIESITWFTHRLSPESNQSKAIYGYFGKQADRVWLRLKISYTAESWLFMEKCTFNIDGANQSLSFAYPDRKTDHAAETIWEWVDLPADRAAYELLTRIAKSQKTLMRYQGNQYFSDREVTAAEKQAIRDLLIAYEAMGGKPPT